jgi:outer membrane usher protein
MRRLLPLAISLALVHAAADTGAAEPTLAAVIVELRVNEQDEGATLVVRRDADGALLLRAADLPPLRIRTPSRGLVLIDGERHFRFAPDTGAEVAFDEATQSARITLPPGAFLPTRTSATSPDLPQVTSAGPGGFLNYDLTYERVSDRNGLGTFLDVGAFGAGGVLTSSLVGRVDDERREAVRLETTWTMDFPERLATLRVGDAIGVAGAWGRSARFGGVQFGTNFATQPTLVTTPLLFAQGEALVPSTVDVFVNNRRVASENVPPGPFTIDRLPPVTGAGQMQVVVTDALGRQQVVAQPFYTGPTLLRAGLQEYSVEVGAIREDFAQASNTYGDLVVSGTYRRGLTDAFTAEVHAEGQAGGASALGLDAAWQLGDLGVVTLTAAAGGQGEVGWLAGAGFERSAPYFNVFLRSRYASEQFGQLGATTLRDRPRLRSFGGVGFGLGRYGNLQLSYGLQTYWSSERIETAGLSHSVSIGDFGFLSLVASHTRSDDSTTDLFFNWTLPFGDRRSASLSVRHSSGATGDEAFEAVASVQQSLPAGAGTGYYAAVSSSQDGQADYVLQGDAGQVGVQFARRNGLDGWRGNANGGLAITSAGILPARRLDRSFAVVEVADFPDMTVFVENQPVGRTDRKGRVLLDSLRAYEANAVSIDPKELPFEASLATREMIVTPAYRSGPVVRFPVARASAATLRLVLPNGQPVPPGATVQTPGERVPVALDGLVYLSAAAGRQQARAEWPGHRCTFTFERPPSGDPQPDLGTIVCDPVASAAAAVPDGNRSEQR